MHRDARRGCDFPQGAENLSTGGVLAGDPGSEQFGGQLVVKNLGHSGIAGKRSGLHRRQRIPQPADNLRRVQTPCQP